MNKTQKDYQDKFMEKHPTYWKDYYHKFPNRWRRYYKKGVGYVKKSEINKEKSNLQEILTKIQNSFASLLTKLKKQL